MKTSGLFTTHRVEIEVQPNKPFYLIPFGDVHRESPQHAHDHWQEFLRRAKEKRDNAIFIGMGDYSDGCSTSERIVLGDGHLHDSTKANLADMYKGVTKTLINELSFMRGRMIGILGGNHYFQFKDGETTDHMLANALGTKFLGVCSFIRLSLRFKGRRGVNMHLDIFAHHGKGGGSTPGATFNTLEKMSQTAVADFYLMGHDHKKGCVPSSPRLTLVSGSHDGEVTVRERTPWLGRTGSFVKAFEPGQVSYAVDAGYAPTSLGHIEFEITPRRSCVGGKDRLDLEIRGTS